jgi:tripartite-type tricarboxylate transporter receptor subunit TctC
MKALMNERIKVPAIAAGLFAAVSAALLVAPAPASAQDNPFAGRPLTMIIGFGAGGGYDLWGRTVSRHMARHLPGQPTVVPQNMPGGGSFVAMNHIYAVAPRDGTVIGIVARDAPMGPLTGSKGARFDALELSWIGTPTTETNVCIASGKAKVRNVQDLFQHELIVGDTGAGTGTYTYPRALSQLLGLRFRLVSGFRSSSEVMLAMERGEVEGICQSYDSVVKDRPDWVEKGIVRILFKAGASPSPSLKNVPSIIDLAKTDEQRQAINFLYAGQAIGRPFVAPPNLPPERLKMLRAAFDATMADKQFREEAQKLNLDVDPVSGADLEKTIRDIYATPKAVIQRVGELIK